MSPRMETPWSPAKGGGTPDRIRTCDFLLRRQALYPAELRAPTEVREDTKGAGLVKGEPNKTALRPLNWGPKGIFQGTQFGPLTDGGLVTHLK